MTPTLFGRWQSRLLLFATVGILVSLPFGIGLFGPPSFVYFTIVFYVAIFGLFWDIVYNQIQQFRWDRDWPAIYQVFAGICEMLFILLIIKIFGLPGVPRTLDAFVFLKHYICVWLAVFIASQSLMRILFVRWRFRGGQWL